jgi:hypothetical protein
MTPTMFEKWMMMKIDDYGKNLTCKSVGAISDWLHLSC